MKLYEEKYPLTVNQIKQQLYVDDFAGGTGHIEDAKKIAEEATRLFADAKMHLRKWTSNDKRLLKHLGQEQEGKPVGFLAQTLTSEHSLKVLGIKWDTDTDTFSFDPMAIIKAVDEIGQPTMRNVLQISSRIFDPIGLLAPTSFATRRNRPMAPSPTLESTRQTVTPKQESYVAKQALPHPQKRKYHYHGWN